MLSLRKRVQIVKSDKVLLSIILIHLLLAFFHFAYSFFSEHQQYYIRCGFCVFIAISSFFFLRKGFSLSILAYGCVLLYFNNFFMIYAYSECKSESRYLEIKSFSTIGILSPRTSCKHFSARVTGYNLPSIKARTPNCSDKQSSNVLYARKGDIKRKSHSWKVK